MSDEGMSSNLWGAFVDWLYSKGEVSIPDDFHERCKKIYAMLDNDISGTINTVLDYMISSASNTIYKIESNNLTLEKTLNDWLRKINLNISGVPTGLSELSNEYFKERWAGSSFMLLRTKGYEKINEISVPTIMWYVDGSSIYVKRKNKYMLGSDEFYLDKAEKDGKLPEGAKENIYIQKPYNRWHDQYANIFLIRRGIYKNWAAMKVLQDKSDKIVSKVLPYLLQISKGSDSLVAKGIVFKDKDLQDSFLVFKQQLEMYESQSGKVPFNLNTYDTKFQHLIPDLTNAVKEELFRQGYRAILAGLGMLELIPVTGQTRQESQLNPKLLIEEVNNGVEGFKKMLLDVIYKIININEDSHRKLFGDNIKIEIVNSPLKINVEQILDALRSSYDRGVTSIKTYQQILGLHPMTEKENRKKEFIDGDEDTFYPHIIVNQEGQNERITPTKPKTNKKEKLEDENKQPNTPESNNFKNANNESDIAKCKKCGHEFDYLKEPEAGMGWVKCPKCEEAVTQEDLIIAPYDKDNPPSFLKKYPKGAQDIFIEVFNKSLPKGEDYAYPVAWTALKRWMKKNGYKKINDKWVKSDEEIK